MRLKLYDKVHLFYLSMQTKYYEPNMNLKVVNVQQCSRKHYILFTFWQSLFSLDLLTS